MGHPLAVPSRIPGNRHPPTDLQPPSPLETALAQVEAWLEAPGLVLIAETGGISILKIAKTFLLTDAGR